MLIDLLFLLFWAGMPMVWHYMLKVAGISLTLFSIPALLILFIYLFQYIGFPILYFQWDDYRAYFVTDKDLVLTAFFYTSVTITLLILGFIASKQNHGILRWNLNHNEIHLDLYKKKQKYNLVFWMLLIMGVSVLLVYLSKVGYGNIALFAVFTDTDLSSQQLRSEMGNNFQGKYHWYKFGMRDILIFLSLALFSYFIFRRTKLSAILLTVTLAITIFSLVAAAEKSPLVTFVLMIFFCYSLILNEKKILAPKSIIKIVTLVFAIQIIFYINFMNSGSIASAFTSTLSRIFSGQMQPIYHYLEIFPQQIDFLWGRSFPNPGGLFPFENFRLTVEVMHTVFPDLHQEGIVGSMPTIFWGEAYANFGVPGVILIPFVVGYLVYYLNVLLYSLKPNPFSIALVIYTAEYISRLSGSGFSIYLINLPLLLMILISFAALFFVNHGSIVLNKHRIEVRT